MEAMARIRLTLRTGSYSWRVGFDRRYRSLVLFGVAETEVANIVAVWGLTLGWRRPPWRFIRCFMEGGNGYDQ